MTSVTAKDRLVHLLDRRAFDPVLSRSSDRYDSDVDRRKLADVKDATRSERKRYHSYGSAEEVKRMFRDDLHSEPAKKIHRELKALGLPTLNDLEAEFNRLCNELGVH